MRRAARKDRNHAAIVAALTRIGATVDPLDGEGTPDLLVGLRGKNYLLEVKDGDAVPSKQKLTPAQEVWHSWWRGQVVVVTSVEEALSAVLARCPTCGESLAVPHRRGCGAVAG